MAFTLRIEIEGLVAFVPNKAQNKVTVLLLNALTPAGMYGGMQVPYHFPVLRIKEPNFNAHWSVPPDLSLQNGSKVFFIAWEDIEIHPRFHHSGSDLHIQNGRRPGSAEPTGKQEARDFSWVVEVAQLIPGSECEPSLLVDSPPRNLLMGRMALDHGRIESAGVVKATGSGRNVIFEFYCEKSMQPPLLAQAMATGVVYTVHIDNDWVDLRLIRFGDRHVLHGRERNVRVQQRRNLETVTVRLRNLPLEELLGLPAFPGSGLDHYGLLYRTLRTIPDDPPMPRPLYEPRVEAGPAAGANTICAGHSLPPAD